MDANHKKRLAFLEKKGTLIDPEKTELKLLRELKSGVKKAPVVKEKVEKVEEKKSKK